MTMLATSQPMTRVAAATGVMSPRTRTKNRMVPPREVWPLLGTLAMTELAMAGIVLWFSAPAVAPVAITGLGIGAVAVAALALALRLFGKLTAPKPTSHTTPHVM